MLLINASAYRPIGRYRRSKHRKLMTHLKLIIVKKTQQLKTSCKDDCGYITQLQQQISKRRYYLAAHRRVVNVLRSAESMEPMEEVSRTGLGEDWVMV